MNSVYVSAPASRPQPSQPAERTTHQCTVFGSGPNSFIFSHNSESCLIILSMEYEQPFFLLLSTVVSVRVGPSGCGR